MRQQKWIFPFSNVPNIMNHRNEKRHAKRAFFADNYRLTATAIISASECITWTVATTAAWRAITAAILVSEAALRAAWLALSRALAASMPAKSLAAANPQCVTLSTIAVCLTVTFLASGMAMTAVRRAVVKAATSVAVAGKTAGATAATIAATKSSTATTARAAVAAWTIR